MSQEDKYLYEKKIGGQDTTTLTMTERHLPTDVRSASLAKRARFLFFAYKKCLLILFREPFRACMSLSCPLSELPRKQVSGRHTAARVLAPLP